MNVPQYFTTSTYNVVINKKTQYVYFENCIILRGFKQY